MGNSRCVGCRVRGCGSSEYMLLRGVPQATSLDIPRFFYGKRNKSMRLGISMLLN